MAGRPSGRALMESLELPGAGAGTREKRMDLARVIGTVVATQKVGSLEGITLLIIQPVDEHGVDAGRPIVASDATNSRGRGELVYYVASGDAVYTGPDGLDLPTDAAVLGIVDAVELR